MTQYRQTHKHTHTHTLIPCITGATVMTYCSLSLGCTAARSHFVLQTDMHLAGYPHTHTHLILLLTYSHIPLAVLLCTFVRCVLSPHSYECVCEHKRGKTTQAVTMDEEGRGESGRGRERGRYTFPFWF